MLSRRVQTRRASQRPFVEGETKLDASNALRLYGNNFPGMVLPRCRHRCRSMNGTITATDARTPTQIFSTLELDDAELNPYEFRIYSRIVRRAAGSIRVL